MVLEKCYSNALTLLSEIIFSSDYFFQSFWNIWVSVTPSDNYFTISPYNLAFFPSTLLHSYPVPLIKTNEKHVMQLNISAERMNVKICKGVSNH